MATQNRAAWQPSKSAHPFEVSPAPMPSPGTDLITIQVHAAAVNPADYIMQSLGVLIDSYPAILGLDGAGVVTAVGTDVTNFQVGDRVTGFCDHLRDLMGKGTFQEYSNLRPEITAKIPDGVSFKDACVLPAGVSTAAFSLFEKTALGLELPPVDGRPAEQKGKVLVIWGGSSSVGCCGIMLAKAAGYDVAAVASGKNQEFCKSVGADFVFDYTKDSVVEDVVGALKGMECVGAVSETWNIEEDGMKRWLIDCLTSSMP